MKAHSSDRDKLQPTSFSAAHMEKSEALISTSQPHSGGDTSQELLTSAGCWAWVGHCILTMVLYEVANSRQENWVYSGNMTDVCKRSSQMQEWDTHHTVPPYPGCLFDRYISVSLNSRYPSRHKFQFLTKKDWACENCDGCISPFPEYFSSIVWLTSVNDFLLSAFENILPSLR